MSEKLTQRENQIIDALIDALWEIETELQANSPDEIKGNPLLRHKEQFVARMRRKIDKWRDGTP